LVADREPVLDEDDAVLDEQPFEDRALPQEDPVFLGSAESQHLLDAGPVVPAAVEQDDLAGRGQLLDVTLEVPLRPLAVVRLRQRDDPGGPRAQVLGGPLDRAALPGGVASFEDRDDASARGRYPFLHLHELLLEAEQLLLVRLLRNAGPRL